MSVPLSNLSRLYSLVIGIGISQSFGKISHVLDKFHTLCNVLRIGVLSTKIHNSVYMYNKRIPKPPTRAWTRAGPKLARLGSVWLVNLMSKLSSAS